MCVDKPRHQEQRATIAVAPDTDAAGNKLDYEAYVDIMTPKTGAHSWGWGKTKDFYGTKEGYGKYIYQTQGGGDLSKIPLVGGGKAKTAEDAAKALLPDVEQVPASEAAAAATGTQDYKTPQQRRQIARAAVAGRVAAPSSGGTAAMTLLGGGV